MNTWATEMPNRALISRDSFLLIESLIAKTDCIYLTAFGFNKSLGRFPEILTKSSDMKHKQHYDVIVLKNIKRTNELKHYL